MSDAQVGKRCTQDTKRKLSAIKRKWAAEKSPEERRALTAAALAAGRKLQPVSQPEYMVRAVLDARGVSYTPQQRVAPYCLDVFVPHLMLDIEIWGDYWHDPKRRPETAAKDARRDAFLRSRGYTVVHIWEHDIRRDPAAALDSALLIADVPSLTGAEPPARPRPLSLFV